MLIGSRWELRRVRWGETAWRLLLAVFVIVVIVAAVVLARREAAPPPPVIDPSADAVIV